MIFQFTFDNLAAGLIDSQKYWASSTSRVSSANDTNDASDENGRNDTNNENYSMSYND